MEFEWDGKKAIANVKKHGIGFHEAATIFGDPLAFTFPDPDHSRAEQRFLTFGLSQGNRVLVVSHTDRGRTVRIISARRMNKRERAIYEED